MAGREYAFRVPRKLKLPLYKIRREEEAGTGLGAQMILALEAWLQKYEHSVTAGTEPYDVNRTRNDPQYETISVNFPVILKKRLGDAAEARRLHDPRLWPDSINAIGIQALKEYLKEKQIST